MNGYRHPSLRAGSMFFVSAIAFYASIYSLLSTLPLILRDRGASPAEVGLVIGVFTATSLLFRVPVGRALGRTPAGTLLRRGQAGVVLSFLVSLLPFGTISILVGRVIQGIGFAAFNTAAYLYLTQLAGPDRRAEYVSLFGLSANVAMGLAPAAGAVVLARLGETGVFTAGAVLALVGLCTVPKDRMPPVAGGAASLWEREAWQPAAAMLGLALAYGSVMAFVPLAVHAAGLEHGWLFFTTYSGTIIATRLVTRRLLDGSNRLQWVFGGIGAAFAGVCFLVLSGGWTTYLVAAALFGIGVGCSHPPLMVHLLESVPPERRGGAAAMATAAFDGGVAAGPALCGWIAGQYSYGASFSVSAGILLALVLPLWLAGRPALRPREEPRGDRGVPGELPSADVLISNDLPARKG